ncbi:DNA primase family protein [uncultured Acetobacterium sp.]|uniref:DNA primase family protein n=1 Tax=uncultured Acetobacterium sp. TaxID=217139 RepID=UPI0025D8A6F2|nr:DNA primase family protein [uncultured Acetobacterium sp.]
MKETCYSDTNSVNNSETNSEANTEINREAKKWGQISPLQISPAAFLAAFGPGPYGLRTFCDQGGGGGKNYTLAGADDPALAKLVAELHRVNQEQQRGVFFVVNQGGHRDAEISRVTAHFVEADNLPLAQQWDTLMAFPLPPSIVVQTRKSLHGYWLMAASDAPGPAMPAPPPHTNSPDTAADPNLAGFRTLQKQLAVHFAGDPVIANRSRVMRLPGFYHCKGEPVAVACLLFEPQRRYRQAALQAVLSKLHPDEVQFRVTTAAPGNPQAPAKSPPVVDLKAPLGDFDLERLLRTCAFIKYCQETAATLPEPLWYPLITNLADVPGGEAAIQRLSAPHPGYSFAATAAKIAHYRQSGSQPFTCETIEQWGFCCPQRGVCPGRRPRDLGQPPLPPWYQKTRTGLRLIPGVLANALAANKKIIYSRQCYYQYLEGVYKKVDPLHVKHIVRKYLRVDDVEMSQINDIHGQWTMEMLCSPDRLNVNKALINLKNGLYDWRTGTLAPHDPELLTTIQLAVCYDPDAAAPIFAAFLNDCLDPATQLVVQELCGYLLIPETRAQKAFVLVGEGGAGKSTLLAVIQELLLGQANVSNISWQKLGEKFLTAELDGRLANIFADLLSRSIEDSSLFKSITGEDWLTDQRKNKDPHAFKTTARLVFSCNSIPKNLGDRSEAFYRRLVIIPFGPPKPAEQRDHYLKDKLAAEAPGILNWALAGLARLIDNGYRFSESTASRAALDRYRVAGSSVLSFVEDCCLVADGRQASAASLYHGYQQYSTASGLRPVSQKRFWMELKESFGKLEKIREKVTRRTMYLGIDLEDFEDFS